MIGSFYQKIKTFIPYTILVFFLILVSVGARIFLAQNPDLVHHVDFQVFVLGTILFIGYYINRIAPKTVVPSFVWAIFAGIALQPFLAFFTEDLESLKVTMEIFAAIILFAGGMEIPFKNFKQWFFPIASLSLFGVIFTSVVFSGLLYFLLNLFGQFDLQFIPSMLILSAALASTDPTAIIPTLKHLRFKREHLKQVAIAESALTDITGSILTRFFLLAFISMEAFRNTNIFSYFLPLARKSTYDALALQIISGILIGYLGFAILKSFYKPKQKNKNGEKEPHNEADPALLTSIPIFTFVLGNALGGAGFLAAFVSGLLSDVAGNLKKASHFYENLLDHLIKPFIFIILGALVPVETLMQIAPVGITAALLFMFVIRPAVVFISLLPWIIQHKFNLQDLLFLSFIRETGIIAAILLIIATTYSVIESQFVIATGMWIILLTLIIEPPLTPFVAKKVGVAEEIK